MIVYNLPRSVFLDNQIFIRIVEQWRRCRDCAIVILVVPSRTGRQKWRASSNFQEYLEQGNLHERENWECVFIYALEQLSTSNRMSVNLVFTQWIAAIFDSPPIIGYKTRSGPSIVEHLTPNSVLCKVEIFGTHLFTRLQSFSNIQPGFLRKTINKLHENLLRAATT